MPLRRHGCILLATSLARGHQEESAMYPTLTLSRPTSSSFFALIVVCVSMFGFLTTPAWAQATSTGTVSGQVTDEQNAAIPDAEVVMTDTSTNTARTTTTNASGRYVFVNVPPGVYNVRASKTGFSQSRV